MASIFVDMAQDKLSKSKLKAYKVGVSGQDDILMRIEAEPENFCPMTCELVINSRFGFVTQVKIKCDHYTNEQLDLIGRWQQDASLFCDYFNVPISFADCILNYNLFASWCNNWFIDNVNSYLMLDMDNTHKIATVHEAYYVLYMCKKSLCKVIITEDTYAYSKVMVRFEWHDINAKDVFDYKANAIDLTYILTTLYEGFKKLNIDTFSDSDDIIKFMNIYEKFLKS